MPRSTDSNPTAQVSSIRRRPRYSKLRSWYRRSVGSVIFWLALATGVTGLGGFTTQYFAARSSPQTSTTDISGSDANASNHDRSTGYDLTIPMFRTVQLFLLDAGAEDDADHPGNGLLTLARIFAAALFFVVSWTAIQRVVDAVRRLPRQLTRKDHVVICGLGQIGLKLLDDLHAAGRSQTVIIIEKDAENPGLEYARSLKATVVIGDAARSEILDDARAAFAKEVFVVTGDDGVNLEISAELGLLLKDQEQRRRTEKQAVYIHVLDVSLATTLRPHCSRLHNTTAMEVSVFNVPKTAATRLTVHQLWPFAPRESNEVAHYVLVGFGAMAQILAVQLAQLSHFPNRKRCRLTIADQGIEATAREFLHLFPRFTSWTDTQVGVTDFPGVADEWEWNEHPLPNDIHMPAESAIQYVCNAQFCELPAGRSDERFAQKIAQQFAAPGVKPVIFVCGHNDHNNFETAIELQEHLTQLGRENVPMFVWLPQQPALAEVLQRGGTLMPFGECSLSAGYDEVVNPAREVMGKIIHDFYQQQGVKDGWCSVPQPWKTETDAFRESSRAAADHMHIKLASCGFRLVRTRDSAGRRVTFNSDNEKTDKSKTILAQMEHNRWVAERLLSGWRFAMPTSKEEEKANKKKRLNKNITPWDQIGQEAKKDFDQIETVLRECQKLKDFRVDRLDSE